MNSDAIPIPTAAQNDSGGVTQAHETSPRFKQFHRSMRLVLAGNPFFLVSAALLLYGIYKLSIDRNFPGHETAQLLFSFSSLQVYELLLAGTAIMLARRRIWYDSTLLAGLENMFVLVSFILVSHAALISQGMAWALCVGGSLLAIVRFASLKRCFAELNLPSILLVLGGVLLAVNAAIPLVFRHGLETRNDAWDKPNLICWLIVLPLLLAAVNALPRPGKWNGLLPERSWLPLAIGVTWIVVTAVHLWSVAYVDDRKIRMAWLTPLVWVLAWTLFNRVGDLAERPHPWLKASLFALPVLVPLLGISRDDTILFLALSGANLAIYAITRKFKPWLAFHLGLVSFAFVIAGLPLEIGRWFSHEFVRMEAVGAAIAAFVLAYSLRSCDPRAGVLGAIAVFGFIENLVSASNETHQIAVQFTLVFLLLHSIRWNDAGHRGAAGIRFIFSVVWIVHSFAWVRDEHGAAYGVVASLALTLAGIVWLHRMHSGTWAPRILLISAGAALLTAPAHVVLNVMSQAPGGLVAVIASFLLFGLGTGFALGRKPAR